MSDLTGLTLKAALDGLSAKTFSSEEITRAHLKAIEGARALNAYVVETPDRAIEMSKASDARRAKGEAGPLDGAPLGIKDLFCTEGVESTAGSKILRGFKPTYESTVTANLWRDGAVMLGKLNMDEFAMGSSNETSAFGPVVNPWKSTASNANLTPGGSSGGSASAVAADLCLAATASDTGGSIRQPAAFTGTVGIKPTYGRASRFGMVAFASSLDQAGPITKTVEDAALLLRSMCSFDAKDSTSLADLYETSRAEGFGKEVQRRLTIGAYVLSAGFYDAYYVRALKVRRRIAMDFDAVWDKVDAIVTPSTPSAAFALGDKQIDPLQMYLNDIFTVTANLAGLPGISVPAGLDKGGLPLGLQVIGKALDEATVFQVASALEDAAGFVAKPEKWW
ncbi:MAG: amidase [Phenylobacterium sp.]|nr:amidase [Phenylobacterium sp.]